MSNQFSYELDERQIRILLQDGELEYDQSAWNRFEQLAQPEMSSRSKSFSPKLNLSISRSVIVPVIFVVLIGGLSATLFSFVDFKKKEEVVSKNTLEADSKPIPAKKEVVITKTTTPVKKEIPATTIVPKEQAVISTATPSVATPVTVAKKEEKTNTVTKPETKPVVNTPAKEPTLTMAAPVKSAPVIMKRKSKKVTSEEIPAINASSTSLNQESQEPELELK